MSSTAARVAAGLALGLAVLVPAPVAGARFLHDTQCSAHGDFAGGHNVTNLSDGQLAARTTHYRACGGRFMLPGFTAREITHAVDPDRRSCRHGFHVGNTGMTSEHRNSHYAHWDYFSWDPGWILWTGAGHWLLDPHNGRAIAYVPELRNWSGGPWPGRVWMDCVRNT